MDIREPFISQKRAKFIMKSGEKCVDTGHRMGRR